MNPIDANLFATLFNNIDDRHDNDDIGLAILNSTYNSLNLDELCRYHDFSSYKTAIPINCADYINVLQVNTRSLNKNYDELITFLNSLPKSPEVISISETWLHAHNIDLHAIDGYTAYHVHRPDDTRGGGVAIYVSSNIPSGTISELCFSEHDVELCTVKITLNNISYIIASLYRPHGKHERVNEFNIIMENLLTRTTLTGDRVIFAGDFNINLLEHESHPPTNNFITIMQSAQVGP